ncbi:MAG: ATP-binding cassette domain-containing protein, partial [Deltaproteobacteria bacterium]|nr:ATP-binding cassette domain-containing protein [Deltaproteobacteria bacterium]
MDLVFALAGRIVVLHRGRVLAEGAPGAIRTNAQVREVYLGEGEIAAAAISPRAPAPAGPVLELQGVDAYYGQSHVLHGLSLRVARGEVVGLLGRNGAGKTTTLRAVMGLTPPRRGVIRCRGTAIAGWPPYEVARLGIGFVPDDRRIFPHLTTRENLELALVGLEGRQGWSVERVYELFPVLRAVDRSPGGALSGGEQKMLAIGRALMAGPELLLLDEPSEGLAPMVIQSLVQALRSIRELGVTILVADQNAKFARAVIDRCYIIDRGVIRYEGTMAALWEDRETLTRYLAV